MAKLTKGDIDKLEAFVDKSSLADVLYALSEIALEKADHLATNWQDTASARVWEKAAGKLSYAGDKMKYYGV